MHLLIRIFLGFFPLLLIGNNYTLEFALTGHQVYHLQSPRYDLVVGSENPSSFGVSKAFLASDSAEDNLITVLSKEHALLDMFTDYLTGESAILLFQGGPLENLLMIGSMHNGLAITERVTTHGYIHLH